MHKGMHNGNEILYIITDTSDEDYAKHYFRKTRIEYSIIKIYLKIFQKIISKKLFLFKNGIKGDGIFGFQTDIIF